MGDRAIKESSTSTEPVDHENSLFNRIWSGTKHVAEKAKDAGASAVHATAEGVSHAATKGKEIATRAANSETAHKAAEVGKRVGHVVAEQAVETGHSAERVANGTASEQDKKRMEAIATTGLVLSGIGAPAALGKGGLEVIRHSNEINQMRQSFQQSSQGGDAPAYGSQGSSKH